MNKAQRTLSCAVAIPHNNFKIVGIRKKVTTKQKLDRSELESNIFNSDIKNGNADTKNVYQQSMGSNNQLIDTILSEIVALENNQQILEDSSSELSYWLQEENQRLIDNRYNHLKQLAYCAA